MAKRLFVPEDASKEQLLDAQEEIENRIFSLPALEDTSELELIGENPEEAYQFIKDWGKFSGLSTGIDYIDDLTYGFEKGELVVMAGEPGIGKSAFVCNLAANFADKGVMPTIISLELTRAQVKSRVGKAHGDGWEELPILLQKVQFIKRKDLANIVQNAVDGGSKVLIVDYIQMLKDETNDEHREISRIVRELKLLALQHKIVIIAISALNRSRDIEKGLQMKDLHGSGAIEFYADQILFLERTSERGKVCVKIVKNRSNPIDFDDNKRIIDFNGAKFTSPVSKTKQIKMEDLPFGQTIHTT